MLDEAAKAARRAAINAELIPLRSRRDGNVSTRNQLIAQLERLQPARNKLRNCIHDALTVARNMENCHQSIPQSHFRGRRRQHLANRLGDTGGNIRTQRDRHQRNLERLETQINNGQNRRDELTGTINTQNNRISALEAELRTLW